MDRLYAVLLRGQDRIVVAWRWLRRHARCVVHGHTTLLVIEPPNQMYVECTTCGHRTQGWGHGPVPVRDRR